MKMKVKCILTTVKNPLALKNESLPNIKLSKPFIESAIPNLSFFSDLISRFNKSGDELIDEIFVPLLKGKKFLIQVVATHNIPEPYDAWTAKLKGKDAFFFNLSLWPIGDLKTDGMAVIKHEIVHILLADLLQKPDDGNSAEIIKYIVINEGIAHYIGYTGNKSKILIDFSDKWETAENRLSDAIKTLSDPNLAEGEKRKLIYKANTGKYWDKYAAIAGMFRAAEIYKKKGAKGLVQCIQNGSLS